MNWKTRFEQKLIDPCDLPEKIAELKLSRKTIATINGAFDILHAGHLHILFEAAQQADVCITALNSDNSIKQYKSPTRPFISLESRLQLIAALEFVDYVTWFNELDPGEILRVIEPDVHVNGAEYRDNCIEAPIVEAGGGQMHYVSLISNLSTTQIVDQILQNETHRNS